MACRRLQLFHKICGTDRARLTKHYQWINYWYSSPKVQHERKRTSWSLNKFSCWTEIVYLLLYSASNRFASQFISVSPLIVDVRVHHWTTAALNWSSKINFITKGGQSWKKAPSINVKTAAPLLPFLKPERAHWAVVVNTDQCHPWWSQTLFSNPRDDQTGAP